MEEAHDIIGVILRRRTRGAAGDGDALDGGAAEGGRPDGGASGDGAGA